MRELISHVLRALLSRTPLWIDDFYDVWEDEDL